MKEIIVTKDNSNQRFDKLLKKVLKEATSGFIYKMLRKKNITLNGKKATGYEVLSEGDSIKIFFSDETFEKLSGNVSQNSYYDELKAKSYDISIIHEDDDKIIINKPLGILSQKAEENDISINEMALSYMINTNQLTRESFELFHPSVVNRLDRNTSGIIIFAKNLQAARSLSAVMKERTAKKMYRAIVKGHVNESQRIEGYLFKDEATNKVEIYKSPKSDAKEIITEYRPLQYLDNNLTLLEIHLVTGRTHQIRAHLSSINHPIIGDNKYGDLTLNKKLQAKYQFLHAYSIEFENGEKYIAPLREDFDAYL